MSYSVPESLKPGKTEYLYEDRDTQAVCWVEENRSSPAYIAYKLVAIRIDKGSLIPGGRFERRILREYRDNSVWGLRIA